MCCLLNGGDDANWLGVIVAIAHSGNTHYLNLPYYVYTNICIYIYMYIYIYITIQHMGWLNPEISCNITKIRCSILVPQTHIFDEKKTHVTCFISGTWLGPKSFREQVSQWGKLRPTWPVLAAGGIIASEVGISWNTICDYPWNSLFT